MSAAHTATPWVVIPQDGHGHLIARQDGTELRLIAHMLERKSSLEEDHANAELIVTACNAWDNADALRARIASLEAQS